MKAFIFSFLTFLCLATHGFSQSEKYFENWNDPEIKSRIEKGIEQNRKGWFTIQFTDQQGNPLSDIKVSLEQQSHDFLFGANTFMLDGFENAKENQHYKDYFLSLFNYTTIPFYWKDVEPERGKLRYEKNSEPIYRRPPPEAVLEFAQKHQVRTKGHPLVWDSYAWFIPDWFPRNQDSAAVLIESRIRTLAERYGSQIDYWDVCNEVTHRYKNLHIKMPDNYVIKSFRMAEKYFPQNAQFLLNNSSEPWREMDEEYSHNYLLAENTMLKSGKVDALGLNIHIFSEGLYEAVLEGDALTPHDLFRTLDLYGRFNRPVHISEITIPTLPDNQQGRKNQAVITENFYRLWFSHPQVEAITWWNMVDNTGAPAYERPDGTIRPAEDKWKGGFLTRDFQPKPSYEVLKRLIDREWKTKQSFEANQDIKIHAFYGLYKVSGSYQEQPFERIVHLSKNGSNEITIRL